MTFSLVRAGDAARQCLRNPLRVTASKCDHPYEEVTIRRFNRRPPDACGYAVGTSPNAPAVAPFVADVGVGSSWTDVPPSAGPVV